MGDESFEQFKEVHQSQLQQIPTLYWESLYEKLRDEIYDAGQYFTMTPLEGGKMTAVASFIAGLSKDDNNNIFIVDHAWLYEPQYAEMQLTHVPGLATRMGRLMGILSEEAVSRRTSQAAVDLSSQCEPVEGRQNPVSNVGSCDLDTVAELPISDVVNGDDMIGSHDPPSPGADSVAFDIPDDVLVAKVLEKMWSYNSSFISPVSNNAEDSVPVWYVMDEFGSAIRHSDTPSFALAPFYYIPKQLSFSVIWCLKDLEYGDEVTRDYIPTVRSPPLARACCMLPWQPYSLLLDDPLWSSVEEFVSPPVTGFPGVIYPSTYDDTSVVLETSQPIKVFTDLELVKSYLTDPRFVICDTQDEASIIWTTKQIKDFTSLKPHQMVNQFPCEEVLTCKDLMLNTARRARSMFTPKSHGETCSTEFPQWLPETYNVVYELPRFVKRFLEQQERGGDNTWIAKPWNLARGIDTHVSNNLSAIIRLGLASPKVVSRYISHPVLFHRPEIGSVKFDFRYVLMLRSVQPLKLYAYNVFWLRFANKPFSMDEFSDYEKHFTVMNYQNPTQLKQIHYDDFIGLFEQQYPNHKWNDIQEKVFDLFRELFTAATSVPAPQGIFPFTKSRAIYAADLMLEWSGDNVMKPQLLEINYSPDCVRACRYHSNFYNHMMSSLFLDETLDIPITPICTT